MKNQECFDKKGNFLGWFSRSLAVVGIPFVRDNNEIYVLASQRGPGTPDPEYRGKWNLCCGYLDFDETVEEAMIREMKEECGVDITYEDKKLLNINSNPNSDKRQNVTLRFLILLSEDKAFYEEQFSHDGNEYKEVGDIAFINIKDIDNYEWAFNHRQVIDMAYVTYKLIMFKEQYNIK
jgi:8-oxo-dGTP pyrophosphatase MutT (NUDIX family)